jgi:predicted 3-demethylubiquinone-9 3-methyltransferase (glyoxalase superfamily)
MHSPGGESGRTGSCIQHPEARSTNCRVVVSISLLLVRLVAKEKTNMQKITPFLWFDNKAEEAMNFYVSVFKNSKVGRVTRYGEAGPGPKGTVMSATFQLDGQDFLALNGGPHFTFTPAISFFVNCETQQEVDELWEKLSEGGKKDRCGWLKDKYGLSWQIIPSVLGRLLQDKDPEKSKRVMQAMLQMDKIDIERLKQAYEGS